MGSWIVAILLCCFFPAIQFSFLVEIGLPLLVFGVLITIFYVISKIYPPHPVLLSEIGHFYESIRNAWGEKLSLLGKLRAGFQYYRRFNLYALMVLPAYIVGIYAAMYSLYTGNFNINPLRELDFLLIIDFMPMFVNPVTMSFVLALKKQRIKQRLHDLMNRCHIPVDQSLLTQLASYFNVTFESIQNLLRPLGASKIPPPIESKPEGDSRSTPLGKWYVEERNPQIASPFFEKKIFEISIDEFRISFMGLDHSLLFVPYKKITSLQKAENSIHMSGDLNQELTLVPHLLKNYEKGIDFLVRHLQEKTGKKA